MKTIKKLERERLHKENTRIRHLLAIYNDPSTDALTKDEIKKRIKFCKLAIGNLPETVRIEIAKHANLLMNGIQESMKYDEFRNLFNSDINQYLSRVASLNLKNNRYVKEKNSGYNLDMQRAILFFDFTEDEIKKIMTMTRDEFMVFINGQYGTQIPMLEELRIAEERRQNAYNDTLEQVKCAKEKVILQVRNGVYIQTEYPLYYEQQVIEYYDKLIEDAEKELKRK